MTAPQDDLRRWQEAGLLSAATVEGILAFEAAREGTNGGEAAAWRPSVPELLVYLAAAITAAGIAVLVATNWEHLHSVARVGIPAMSAVVAFSVGYVLRQRPEDVMLRAASILWLLAGGLAVATVAIVAAESGLGENNVAIVAGTAAILLSIALWMPMRMHPQIVGMGGAAFLFSTALSSAFSEDWIVGVLGASLAVFGLLALMAVESGWLVPRSSGRLLAGAGLGFGGFFAGMPPSPAIMEVVTLGSVSVLLVAGIRFRSLVYIACGVLTAFVGMLTLILRYVDNPTYAGLALVAVGLVLMLAIAALARTRPWSAWHRAERQSTIPVATSHTKDGIKRASIGP